MLVVQVVDFMEQDPQKQLTFIKEDGLVPDVLLASRFDNKTQAGDAIVNFLGAHPECRKRAISIHELSYEREEFIAAARKRIPEMCQFILELYPQIRCQRWNGSPE